MTIASVAPAGLSVGTWVLDTAHSEISFTVRHMGLFKVRGSFTEFAGSLTVAERLEDSTSSIDVDLASVDTREPNRDNHLRSTDFFDVTSHPRMTYRSSRVRLDGDNPVLVGELTLRGTTRPFELTVEPIGAVMTDPMGKQRTGFLASGQLSRADFGVNFNLPMHGDTVVIGDKVQVNVEIQAVLDDGEDEQQA